MFNKSENRCRKQFYDMEVRGKKITSFAVLVKISRIDMILKTASPKLKRAILGKVKRSLANFKSPNTYRFKRSKKRKVSSNILTHKNKNVLQQKKRTYSQRKKVVLNIQRKATKIIHYTTHSCVDECKIRSVMRRPGLMVFAFRSRRMLKAIERRLKKRKRADLRSRAIDELRRMKSKTAQLQGFPCIPDKFQPYDHLMSDYNVKTTATVAKQIKSKRKKISKPRKTAIKKKTPKRKNSRKKQSIDELENMQTHIDDNIDVSNWKIVVKSKSTTPETEAVMPSEEPAKDDIEKSFSFSYDNLKTPSDRWRAIQVNLPYVKTWNKKFPKSKTKTEKTSVPETAVERYIHKETGNKLRKAIFKKWELNSKHNTTKTAVYKSSCHPHLKQPLLGHKILTHVSPPESPEELTKEVTFKIPSKKKSNEYDSQLLNEILALQSPFSSVERKPSKQKKKVSTITKRKRKKKQAAKNFHSEDLLVSVNRNTAFWFELTSRSQPSTTKIEKQRIEVSAKPESSESVTPTPLATPAADGNKLDPRSPQASSSKSDSRTNSPAIKAKVSSLLDALFPETYPVVTEEDLRYQLSKNWATMLEKSGFDNLITPKAMVNNNVKT